jgi:aryl-alcohol dehydrogenase-like predicted oxidoreductase
MLELAEKHKFNFDTAQMPLNVMDAHFRSFAKEVVPVLVKKQVSVLGMKSMGSGFILKSNTVTPMVITGIDSQKVLDQACEAAKTSAAVTPSDIAKILQKTAAVAADGKFEPFKTSSGFDSTAAHPEWMG